MRSLYLYCTSKRKRWEEAFKKTKAGERRLQQGRFAGFFLFKEREV